MTCKHPASDHEMMCDKTVKCTKCMCTSGYSPLPYIPYAPKPILVGDDWRIHWTLTDGNTTSTTSAIITL